MSERRIGNDSTHKGCYRLREEWFKIPNACTHTHNGASTLYRIRYFGPMNDITLRNIYEVNV